MVCLFGFGCLGGILEILRFGMVLMLWVVFELDYLLFILYVLVLCCYFDVYFDVLVGVLLYFGLIGYFACFAGFYCVWFLIDIYCILDVLLLFWWMLAVL